MVSSPLIATHQTVKFWKGLSNLTPGRHPSRNILNEKKYSVFRTMRMTHDKLNGDRKARSQAHSVRGRWQDPRDVQRPLTWMDWQGLQDVLMDPKNRVPEWGSPLPTSSSQRHIQLVSKKILGTQSWNLKTNSLKMLLLLHLPTPYTLQFLSCLASEEGSALPRVSAIAGSRFSHLKRLNHPRLLRICLPGS